MLSLVAVGGVVSVAVLLVSIEVSELASALEDSVGTFFTLFTSLSCWLPFFFPFFLFLFLCFPVGCSVVVSVAGSVVSVASLTSPTLLRLDGLSLL